MAEPSAEPRDARKPSPRRSPRRSPRVKDQNNRLADAARESSNDKKMKSDDSMALTMLAETAASDDGKTDHSSAGKDAGGVAAKERSNSQSQNSTLTAAPVDRVGPENDGDGGDNDSATKISPGATTDSCHAPNAMAAASPNAVTAAFKKRSHSPAGPNPSTVAAAISVSSEEGEHLLENAVDDSKKAVQKTGIASCLDEPLVPSTQPLEGDGGEKGGKEIHGDGDRCNSSGGATCDEAKSAVPGEQNHARDLAATGNATVTSVSRGNAPDGSDQEQDVLENRDQRPDICEDHSRGRQGRTRAQSDADSVEETKVVSTPEKKHDRPHRSPAAMGGEEICSSAWKDFNFEQQVLLDLLMRVRWKIDLYGFFALPVDPVRDECPDYYEVIDRNNEAMDLGTMEGMIKDGTIADVDDFERNLKRIVHCAQKYNSDEDNFVRQQADLIEGRSQPLLVRARRKVEHHTEKKPATDTLAQEIQEPDVRGRTGGRTKRRLASRDEESFSDDESDAQCLSQSDSCSSLFASSSVDDDDVSVSGGQVAAAAKAARRGRRSRLGAPRRVPRQGGTKSKTPSDDGRTQRRRKRGREMSEGAVDQKSLARPSRAAKKKDISYIEDDSKGSGTSEQEDDSTNVDETMSESSSAESAAPSSRPPRRKSDFQEADIPGSEIPHCDKDLSTSTIVPYSSRKEWLSLIPEMVTVCNEAARRSTLVANPEAECYEKPLSDVYMRERLEYDKPLMGLVARTKSKPQRVQGFIVTTNFMVFREYFRWTMDVPAAAITPTDRRLYATDDGALTAELQSIERCGVNSREGFVFPRVAEISLLGGLGCGGALVARTLSELQQSNKYDYVVLQSTKMAISFYERRGFVRVGAVTRLKDNPTMPEVAYRHWSEIVDGEAVEASYMMALRLGKSQQSPLPCLEKRAAIDGVVPPNVRQAEIISALRAARSLLLEALTVRATGSTAYSNSYRELISTARIFAKSAQDYHMIRTIDRALAEFTGTMIGNGRSILRDELNLPKSRAALMREQSSFCESTASTMSLPSFSSVSTPGPLDSSAHTGSSSVASTGLLPEQVGSTFPVGTKNVKVSIKMKNGEKVARGSPQLVASVPKGWLSIPPKTDFHLEEGWELREVAVSVVADKYADEYEPLFDDDAAENSKEGSRSLRAKLHMPSFRSNLDEVTDAISIALDNLRESFPTDTSESKEDSDEGAELAVTPGDSVMLKVDAYDGSPLWVPVHVQRHCRKHEIPEGGDRDNSYVVKLLEADGSQLVSRVLDKKNQGVGRDWCTRIDWFSFPALPAGVLDALLIGSWVQYPDEKGSLVEGIITRRVGGGLRSEPMWRVSLSQPRIIPGSSLFVQHEDLEAGPLREAVSISDENIQRMMSLVTQMKPCARPVATESIQVSQTSLKNKRRNPRRGANAVAPVRSLSPIEMNDDVVDAWATSRINEFQLCNQKYAKRQVRAAEKKLSIESTAISLPVSSKKRKRTVKGMEQKSPVPKKDAKKATGGKHIRRQPRSQKGDASSGSPETVQVATDCEVRPKKQQKRVTPRRTGLEQQVDSLAITPDLLDAQKHQRGTRTRKSSSTAHSLDTVSSVKGCRTQKRGGRRSRIASAPSTHQDTATAEVGDRSAEIGRGRSPRGRGHKRQRHTFI